MKYSKARAEVMMFDNSDVIITSDCTGWSNQNCPHGNGGSFCWGDNGSQIKCKYTNFTN